MHMERSVSGVRLSDVLTDSRFFGTDEIRVTSCCGDSETCQSGDLFVAHVGDDVDGHDEVQQAISQGATAVLAERYLPVTVPQCVVPDSRIAFGQVCHALAGDPCDEMCVVGVTGTLGKSSTQVLLSSVFEAAGFRTAVHGSFGSSDCLPTRSLFLPSDEPLDTSVAHPTSARIAKWLADSQANGCSHAVFEASSEILARRVCAGLKLDAAVITNLGSDHLEVHGSVRNYHQAKTRLLQQLKPGGVTIASRDDRGTKSIIHRLPQPLVMTSVQGNAELSATIIERHASEQVFLLSVGRDTIPVRTSIVGDAHVANCLTAAAAGLVLGIDLQTVARGLESVARIPGRFERVECGQDFSVLVDAAPTPESLAHGLRTLSHTTEGRLICVFGEGPLRGVHQRPHRGRVVENLADEVVLTSDNPHDPQPLQSAHDVLDGFDRPAQARLLPDRVKAICWALAEAEAGDTVLIAGQQDRSLHLSLEDSRLASDADVVRWWLREVGVERTCPWVPA